MIRHFAECAICGLPGHKAKDCALNQLEQVLDPLGEMQRKAEFRTRERDRQHRRQQSFSGGVGIQTSRGFGL